MKLVYFEIVVSVVVYNLYATSSANVIKLNPDTVSNTKSFKKCLGYTGVNGTIDDLIPIDVLRSSDKIVGGGYDAYPEEFPFMAALGYGNETKIKYSCGGTLISDRFVLTAAHCIFSRTWGVVKFVRSGDLNLQSESDNDGVQMRQAQDSYVHPNYKYPLKYHDIALINLDKPVVFSSKVSPACLDFGRYQLPQLHLYVAGWGSTGYGEEQSDHLQVGEVVSYNISECQKTFVKELSIPNGIDDETQICAGAGGRLTDTCETQFLINSLVNGAQRYFKVSSRDILPPHETGQYEGDSGGPLGHSYLLQQQEEPIHFVIGVTSFGKTCLQGRIPAVYVRVSYYTDWIGSVVWPAREKALGDKIVFSTD